LPLCHTTHQKRIDGHAILQGMKTAKIIFVLAALALLIGCSIEKTPTFIVHGTLTNEDGFGTGNIIITVYEGSDSFTTTVPATTPSEVYSVSGVPAGTYSVDIVYTAPGGSKRFEFFIDTVSMLDEPGFQSPPGTWTGTFSDVSVSGDVLLDVRVYNNS
jgi:hypothetical protein